jgi:hypothetical protein
MNASIRILATASLLIVAACSGGGSGTGTAAAQSCMGCHNGSQHDDYSGPGLENPHPFPGADNLQCTTCHGGNPNGTDEATSHVPPPPQIGDRTFQTTNALAYFNKLTLAGMDKFPDYTANGGTHRLRLVMPCRRLPPAATFSHSLCHEEVDRKT